MSESVWICVLFLQVLIINLIHCQAVAIVGSFLLKLSGISMRACLTPADWNSVLPRLMVGLHFMFIWSLILFLKEDTVYIPMCIFLCWTAHIWSFFGLFAVSVPKLYYGYYSN